METEAAAAARSYHDELERLLIDADRVGPNLYQGAKPPIGQSVALAGFDTLVLTARELLPFQRPDLFQGVEVLQCPLRDHDTRMDEGDPEDDWTRARDMARRVAARIRLGKRVLVTCHEGWNRSGLICALALHELSGRPGALCVQKIRQRRDNALSQPVFVRRLNALG